MSFFFSKNYTRPVRNSECPSHTSSLWDEQCKISNGVKKALRIFLVLVYVFAGNSLPVFAVIYQPGETLNPSCFPTDLNCGVQAPITATSSGAFVFGGGTAPAGTLLYVSGTSTLQNIIPDGNLAYSIGTPEKRLKEVYTKDLILGASSFVMEEIGGVLRFRDASSTIPGLVIDPSVGGIINGNIVVNGGASFQNATTTGEHRIGTLVLGGNSIQNLVGSGLQVASGTLALNTSGDWIGTFDGREGSYYLANSFSATTADTWFGGKSTTNLAEGSNLYFTDSRFDNRFSQKTTSDLAEGSNLFYTDARARSALSTTAAGLSYSTSTGALSLVSGYTIPLTVSTTDWQSFFATPSSRISAGTNLLWNGNALQGASDSYMRGLFSVSSPLNFSTTTGGFSLAPLTTSNLAAAAGILNSQLASSTIGLSIGTSGADVNVAGSPASLGGSLMLNIPDAGVTARGLITTGAQTFAGAKTFSNSPTLSSLSAGSVLFIGAGGLILENNQNLFWDDINKRLGIGTSTTTEALTINGNMQFTSQATTISLASSTAGTAPALTMLGASTNAINGIGGALNITGGAGGTNLSTGGAVNITSGSGLTGGAITLQGSNNISGGQIRLFGGTGGLGGAGGALTLKAGNSGGDNAVAGSVSITAGNITTGNNTTAGSITLQSGNGGTANGNIIFLSGSGRVGIGTSTPSGTFHVYSASIPNALVVATNGNVGIGTADPSAKIHLAGGVFLHTPDAPQFITGLELSSAVNKIAVAGRYLYSVHNNSAGGNEFNIIDISNPASPVTLGGLNYTTDVRTVAVSGNYAYIGLSANTGGTEFRIIDISNPSVPVELGGTEHGDNVYAIALSGRYAFVGHNAGTNEFDVVDISNPLSPQIVGGVDLGGTGMSAYSIKIQGRYAYVGGGNATVNFWVIDISNPLAPSIVASADLQDTVFGLDIKGRYAYVGFGSNSTRDFGIVDIKNPTLPALAGSLEIDNNNTNEIAVAGKYAYVARDSTLGSGELFVIDVSNPATPVIIASTEVNQTVNALAVSGKYAFIGKVTNGGAELDAYNLSGMDSPAAHIGALAVEDLSSAGNALVAGDLAVGSSLRVGSRGIATDGTLAINGTSTSFFAGSVGIGVVASSYKIELPNNADSSGQGRANAWVTYSDESLKENRQALAGSLEKILALQGVSFIWKGTNFTSTGFIAQEVEEVLPELVSAGEDGIKSLDYGRFAPYLVEAIKEIVRLGDTFKNALISWLADAANGIGRIFAREYCGIADDSGTYCLTGEDIKRLGGQLRESVIQPSNHGSRVEENQKLEIKPGGQNPNADQQESDGPDDAGEINREESWPEKTNIPEETLLNEGQIESQEIGLEEAANDGL
ncbi:MAG: tail fiber domain-containing protein [Parcubacteria group bacterium]|nr:tail fiber domain-containing protein [Parcubacteria group bacterium]